MGVLPALGVAAPVSSPAVGTSTAGKAVSSAPANAVSAAATPPVVGVQDQSYVVQADDVISIVVQRHPEFSAPSVIIPQGGVIVLPVVNKVKVAGKTIAQIDNEITNGLKVRLRRPEVTVTLDKARLRPIYISGAVTNAGIFDYKDGWRLTQAVSVAGGLNVEPALSAVEVSRGAKIILNASLLPILQDPSSPQNILLKSGDSLRFYERVTHINISGAVSRPGAFVLPEGSGVVEAIGLAGGPLDNASLTRATLRRANGRIVPVDLYRALRLEDKTQNFKLIEGDVLVIPARDEKISVYGAVAKPGQFPLPDGRPLRVADAIALSGGFTPRAALTQGILRRANGTSVNLNLYDIIIRGSQTDNVALAPDDSISIPEARGITVLGVVNTPGNFNLETGAGHQLSDALALAGGITAPSETVKVSVTRPNGTNGTAAIIATMPYSDLSDPTKNTALQDGDVINLTATKKITVKITGEVKTPGAYQLSEGEGIPDLIARAGGPTVDSALSQITVTRASQKVIMIDASKALLQGADKLSVGLEDNDLVVVPRSKNRVLVLGAVTKSDSFAIPEDRPLTVGDTLALAGGARNLAKLKEIALMRQTPTGIQRYVIGFDKEVNGRLAVNTVVQPGDIIYVPEGKVSRSTFDTALSLAGPLRWLFP